MAGTHRLVVLLAFMTGLSACSSGASTSGGERFVSAPTTTSTTTLSQAFNGSYDIDITKVETGATCRTSGTFHETVSVEDVGGTRRITLTNNLPSADGQNEVEVGSVQPDGSFDASGAFGTGVYSWKGTLPGDGTIAASFTATVSGTTCVWTLTGHRT